MATRNTPVQGTSALSGWTSFELLRWGREVVHLEAQSLSEVAQRLDDSFPQAIERIERCSGNVVVSGMGKAGLVGQKISATFCSTGTPSIFLHPAEAIHGDLGRLKSSDLILMLSQSGQTEEIVRLLPSLAEFGIEIVAITARSSSALGRAAAVTIELGPLPEAGANGLAPSTSTTAMMALGDALALVVSRLRGFGPQQFARFHPGGSLGLKLAAVEDVMRPLEECRVALESLCVREVFAAASRPGRRSGAIMLCDECGRLTGVFTDSDLARLIEHRQDHAFDRPIRDVMTAAPTTVALGAPLPRAVDLLAARKISELPVVDAAGKPAGMIDITDVLALLPHDAQDIDRSELRAPRTIPFTKKPA